VVVESSNVTDDFMGYQGIQPTSQEVFGISIPSYYPLGLGMVYFIGSRSEHGTLQDLEDYPLVI